MKRDQIVFDLISKEDERQRRGIELIASENFVSEQVMKAMGSCLTNKYAGIITKSALSGKGVVQLDKKNLLE